MSSYYPSFRYLGTHSTQKNVVVAHFDADQGEMDTFLGMEPIYTERSDGSRLDYGAKYNNVATFRITVIKPDGSDFSTKEVRDHLSWMTGSKQNSTLDLTHHFSEEFVYNGNSTFELANIPDEILSVKVNGNRFWGGVSHTLGSKYIGLELDSEQPQLNNGDVVKIEYYKIQYYFIGRVTNAWQYKLDARTIGLIYEFTNNSPWAYSALQFAPDDTNFVNGELMFTINNESDDHYGYTPVEIVFENTTGDALTIINYMTGDTTEITGLGVNETITMNSNMMITSSVPNKVFGNTFNFVFQRLISGSNEISVQGYGMIRFKYVYAIKIGDCAIDVNAFSYPIYDSNGNIQVDTLHWSRIVDTPTTYQGYGITNVYSKLEVDALVSGIEIDEVKLNQMLKEELG